MPAKRKAQRSKKRRLIIVAVLSVICLVIFIALATLLGGNVRGLEFSPTHFTLRKFQLYEIPVVHLQVTPIDRSGESLPAVNLIRSQNYIQVPQGDSDSWHLVEISRGLTSKVPGDAELLVSRLQLAADKGGTPVWEDWTRDHPAAAAVLWPIVQKLAKRELYLLVPDLMEIAERETDPQRLSSAIDLHLRDEYFRLARDLAAADEPILAEAVLRDGLSDYPDDQPMLDLQAELR
jgi:hypothetical protein